MTGCLNNDASLGAYFRMAVEPSDLNTCVPATFDGSSERYEILSENIRYTDTVVGSNGLTGTMDRIANHLRPGTRLVFGRMVMEVGPNELSKWLPRILGNTGEIDGITYTTDIEHSLIPFDILMQRDQGTVIYRHCVVSRAMFQGAQARQDNPEAQVIRMVLDIVGAEEHGRIGASLVQWPTPGPTLPATQRLFWLFGDSELLLQLANPPADPANLPIDQFNLLIDNNLQYKTRNNINISFMRGGERVIRLQAETPYTVLSHPELYLDRFDGTGSIKLRGDKNLAGELEEPWLTEFEFPRLYSQRVTPATRGRSEIMLTLDLTAYRTSTDEPIIITNRLTV